MDNNSNQQQTVQSPLQPQPIEPVSSIQPDQQPPAESQSFIPPSHDFLHILKLIIIVLLFILLAASIGAGGYFLGVKKNQPITQAPTPTLVQPTPTPNPTANWKTYVNVRYKFSIKYPQDWIYIEVSNEKYKTENDGVWFSTQSLGFPPVGTGAAPPISLTISKTDPLVNWKPEYFNNYKSEPYKLGNISGLKISGINKEGLSEEGVIIIQVKNFYISAISNQGTESLTYFDQILSTFKFTN